MRGQLGLGTLLPRQNAGRRAGAGDRPEADAAVRAAWARGAATRARALTHDADSAENGTGVRTTALRYASWNWPIAPSAHLAATTDLEQVFAFWSHLPQAPILADCGVAFDVVEAEAGAGRAALARLDRLGVELGPVLITGPQHPANCAGPAARPAGLAARIGFLVRADTAAALNALIDPRTGPVLMGRGERVELPRRFAQSHPHQAAAPTERLWLRAPSAERPVLPAAHVVLGALALAPRRASATRR